MENTVEIMDEGIRCLVEKMGVVKAEKFISTIKRESFDYTKWRADYFGAMEPGEFQRKALEYAKEHPYTGKAKRV